MRRYLGGAAYQMKTLYIVLAIGLTALSEAQACSCVAPDTSSEEEQIKKEFSEADAVVIAKVVSVEQSLDPEDPSGTYRIEEARFVVEEVLKGTHKVGETIRVRSVVGRGACGRSARNDPPWIEVASEVLPSASGVAVLSDEWLIYTAGQQPYDLSRCSRSFPMNLRGGEDAEYLRGMLASGSESSED
ncbi:hypothetical protein GCM10011488_06760 [Steroidobacter agaridevorans]|nr:hypothetical protein GCM10011488_06760 [Steroidobacter agaridevorans]